MRDMLLSAGVAHWLLPAMVLWPLVAAALVRLLGREPGDGLDARLLTVLALTIEGVLGLVLWFAFDPSVPGWQARVDFPWLPDIGATFSVGVDGLGMSMTVLSSLVLPLAFLASWDNVRVRTSAFGMLALLMTSGMIGIFVSLDLLMFYLAWELLLIPMYFLIGVWGTGNSARAALRYVLFTLLGSLLMLVAIIVLWSRGGGTSFHLDHLIGVQIGASLQLLLFLAFFVAFAVKSGLVPFHTWLPDAQSSAPTFVAVALGFKVGTYALLRFAFPLFPAAVSQPTLRNVVIVLSVISIIYGALLATAQRDLKRIIAYSSISHLGFIMLGAFALTAQGLQGSILVMINHGVTTSALFLLAGALQDRRGTTDIDAFGGLARVVPLFSVFLAVAILSTIGLPGTNGFVGEFLVLIGAFAGHRTAAIFATSGVIFAAMYGLRALQGVLFESVRHTENASLRDLSRREVAALGLLTAAMLWIGVAPEPVLDRLAPSTAPLVQPGQTLRALQPAATTSLLPTEAR